MKKAVFFLIAALMLCSCSGKSDGGSKTEKTQTTAPVEQEQKRETKALTAEVISFEGDTLTLMTDKGEVSFDTNAYYRQSGLEEFDRAIVRNPFGIRVSAAVSYYEDKNELISLDLVSQSGEALGDELYIKSIGENTAVLDMGGRELEADISALAYTGSALFGEEYINGPYIATGIIFKGSEKCMVCELAPLTGDSGGIKNYGVEEKDMIESYLCAEVVSCDSGRVTLLRNEDKKQVTVRAAVADDPSQLKEGSFVFYAPLDDKGYDDPELCVLLLAGDIEGVISYASDYQGSPALTLQSGERIEALRLLDKQGEELAVADIKGGRASVNACDILSRGRLFGGDYRAAVVTVE